MKDVMKIATVNFPAVWGDKEKNLGRILDYIDIAGREGVQMLIFPETALTGYDVEPKEMPAEERMHRRLAETIPGNATDKVCELTKKYDIRHSFMNAVWAGGMEKCDWTPERYVEWYKDAIKTDYWKEH